MIELILIDILCFCISGFAAYACWSWERALRVDFLLQRQLALEMLKRTTKKRSFQFQSIAYFLFFSILFLFLRLKKIIGAKWACFFFVRKLQRVLKAAMSQKIKKMFFSHAPHQLQTQILPVPEKKVSL